MHSLPPSLNENMKETPVKLSKRSPKYFVLVDPVRLDAQYSCILQTPRCRCRHPCPKMRVPHRCSARHPRQIFSKSYATSTLKPSYSTSTDSMHLFTSMPYPATERLAPLPDNVSMHTLQPSALQDNSASLEDIRLVDIHRSQSTRGLSSIQPRCLHRQLELPFPSVVAQQVDITEPSQQRELAKKSSQSR